MKNLILFLFLFISTGIQAQKMIHELPAKTNVDSTNWLFLTGNPTSGKLYKITAANLRDSIAPATDTTSLSNRIDLKLNTTDTASLSTRIDSKLSATDTASLSNRIDAVSVLDTSSLSLRIEANDFFVEDYFTLTGLGTEASPYLHADSTAGIQSTIDANTTARLSEKRYNVSTPILIRNTNGDTKNGDILGTVAHMMYPNAEGEPETGTRIKYTGTAVKIGTTDLVNQPRPGRPRITNTTFWGPGKSIVGDFNNFTGAAIHVDGSVDQPQFESLHISNAPFGFVGTGIWDAGTVRNVNIIGNIYPIWFSDTMTSGLYVAFEDITVADNQGPIVIGAGSGGNTVGVIINASTICYNGNIDLGDVGGGDIPNCNIYLAGSNSIISNSYITNGGLSNSTSVRIAADGIIITGDYNQIIGNVIAGQNQAGTCGVRVKSGANGNIINSNFRMVNGFFPTNTTDVIIEAGATNTTVYQYPGMTVTDAGTGTIIIDGSGSAAATLTENYVGVGNASNELSGSSALQYAVVTGSDQLTLGTGTNNTKIIADYKITGGAANVLKAAGTGMFEWGASNQARFGIGSANASSGRDFYFYDLVGGGYVLGWSSDRSVIIPGTLHIGGTAVQAASSALEITSTTKGFLPPRMTAAQAGAISSPAEGLLVYVTDTDGTFTAKGWWGWDGSAWAKLNN